MINAGGAKPLVQVFSLSFHKEDKSVDHDMSGELFLQ